MSRRTTSLDALRKGEAYAWGSLIAIHGVGRYAFVEYARVGCAGDRETLFALYVDDRDMAESFHSLEEAMLGAVAARLERNEARWMFVAARKLFGFSS